MLSIIVELALAFPRGRWLRRLVEADKTGKALPSLRQTTNRLESIR